MQRIHNFVQDIINSNYLYVVEALDVFPHPLIATHCIQQRAVSIWGHANLTLALHQDFTLSVDSWKHALLEKHEIIFYPTKVVVLGKEFHGL